MSESRLKLFAFLLVLIFTVGLFPYFRVNASVIDSGTCGDDLTWTLDDEGVLTISGTGDMYDYSYIWNEEDPYPWEANDNYKSIKEVVISSGVTSIGDFAFCDCENLTSVVIPDSVTSIGYYSFDFCSSLTNITIPDSVTSIDKLAFHFCSGLTSITIPDSVTSIDYAAFSGCTSLTSLTIPDSLTSISDQAFAGCTSLKELIIPDSVISIEYAAFSYCDSLESVTISKRLYNSNGIHDNTLKGLKTSNPGIFHLYNSVDFSTVENGKVGIASRDYDTGIVTLYVTPDSGYKVDEITVKDSSGTSALTPVNGVYSVNTLDGDVTVSATFKALSVVASGTCGDNLTWMLDEDGVLRISGTGDMEDYISVPWVNYLSDINTVVISSGVTSIGKSAFLYCSNLTNVTIPDSVTSIGDQAFSGCTSLASISIPDGVTSIGNSAFRACGNLTAITIPDGLTSISSEAFYECSGLTNITIPDSVTEICNYAFCGCTGLTRISIPENVTSILNGAFKNCSNLKSITIPNNVDYIGYFVFEGCTKLESVTLSKSLYNSKNIYDTTLKSLSYDKFHLYNSVIFETGENGKVGIASRDYETGIVTLYVTPDPDYQVGEITITDSNGMDKLFPENGVYSVDTSNGDVKVTTAFIDASVWQYGTFGDNDNLTWALDMDGVLTISGAGDMPDLSNAPWNDYISSIYSVVISSGVTSIGMYAFDSCENLTSVTIPDSVTKIDYSAFVCCESLTDIIIPDSVTSIDRYAFGSCSSLTSITIPDGVKSIEFYTFWGCTSLSSVTIPVSVTSIDEQAFGNCTSLSDVYYCGTSEQFESIGYNFGDGVVVHYATPLEILTQPSDFTGPVGSKAEFSIEAEGDDLTYQWQYCSKGIWKNSGTAGNKTSKITVDITNARDGMKFRCVVKDGYGNEKISDEVAVHVGSLLVITGQPEDFTGQLGSTATFSITAKGDDLTYQWQYCSKGAWKNSGAAGNKTPQIAVDITSARDGMKFRCLVTDKNGSTKTTEEAVIHVAPTLTITEQPADYTGPIGSTAAFSIEAEGDDLTYQWQYCSKGVWKNSGATGYKTPEITVDVTNTRDGMKFRCVVTDGYGIEKISDEAAIHVGTLLVITGQPEDFTGPVGSTATFSVEADGEDLTYQWQYCSKGVWKNSGAAGNKTPEITVDITNARDGMKFRCVVTDKNGATETTEEAAIHAAPVSTIIVQPADYSGTLNSKATFSIEAEGDDLTYQWQYYSKGTWKNSGAAGNKTPEITVDVTGSRDGMKFRCIVTDKYGNEEISDEVTLHVIEAT